MSEIQDSAAIIAADMRQLADDIEAGRAIVGQSVWRSYADRVEAIGTGNIAKLRNALELSKVAILVAKKKMNLENPVILEVIDDALAAPARNCDTGTWQQQEKRFENFCNQFRHDYCRGCSLGEEFSENHEIGECRLAWAQRKYESEVAK